MHAPPTKKVAPGFATNERQAQKTKNELSRDRRTGPTTTQAEEIPAGGFFALFTAFERKAETVARFNRLGSEIAGNVARGRCVLCGGRGGDTINPGDPCPMCRKERGE